MPPLMEVVREYPCLYDLNVQATREEKEVCWRKAARVMKKSAKSFKEAFQIRLLQYQNFLEAKPVESKLAKHKSKEWKFINPNHLPQLLRDLEEQLKEEAMLIESMEPLLAARRRRKSFASARFSTGGARKVVEEVVELPHTTVTTPISSRRNTEAEVDEEKMNICDVIVYEPPADEMEEASEPEPIDQQRNAAVEENVKMETENAEMIQREVQGPPRQRQLSTHFNNLPMHSPDEEEVRVPPRQRQQSIHGNNLPMHSPNVEEIRGQPRQRQSSTHFNNLPMHSPNVEEVRGQPRQRQPSTHFNNLPMHSQNDEEVRGQPRQRQPSTHYNNLTVHSSDEEEIEDPLRPHQSSTHFNDVPMHSPNLEEIRGPLRQRQQSTHFNNLPIHSQNEAEIRGQPRQRQLSIHGNSLPMHPPAQEEFRGALRQRRFFSTHSNHLPQYSPNRDVTRGQPRQRQLSTHGNTLQTMRPQNQEDMRGRSKPQTPSSGMQHTPHKEDALAQAKMQSDAVQPEQAAASSSHTIIKEKDDVDHSFGVLVTSVLRKLPPIVSIGVRGKIYQILTEAEAQTYLE